MTGFDKRYPTVAKTLVEAIFPPPKDGKVFATLRKYKAVGGRQVYSNGAGRKIVHFVWDAQHGHWEVYTRLGVNTHSIKNDGSVVDTFAKRDDRKRLIL